MSFDTHSVSGLIKLTAIRSCRFELEVCPVLIISRVTVLIDPQMRTIYDLYGVQGVESGQHLALYDMDRNKVIINVLY